MFICPVFAPSARVRSACFFTSLGMFVHVYARVCATVNLMRAPIISMFVKQTNSLKPKAEHSSALESASDVGCWNGCRDMRGFDSQAPKNDHQRGLFSPNPETSANEACEGI